MTTATTTASAPTPAPSPHNLLNFDYRAQAARLGPPVVPIIDAHSHIHGDRAARIYDEVRRLFGVTLTYSMTQLAQAQAVRDALGDSIRFIAIPSFSDADRAGAHRRNYLATIEAFHARFGSRMMKLWASPRLRDLLTDATDVADVDTPIRREHCRLGQSLGMMFMVHIADPDTWFSTKYADASRYGTKRHQYVALERMLDDFPAPWIAAHMGGWPEDLAFLDALLTRHDNLYLDTSATKWVVRELSRHTRDEVLAFFWKWKGRVLFGSDIVVMEEQLSPAKTGQSAMGELSSSPEEAFLLYASRYWALRTMFETAYHGPSPIADPDLKMVDPKTYNDRSSPTLRGFSFPPDLLTALYSTTATTLLDHWWSK